MWQDASGTIYAGDNPQAQANYGAISGQSYGGSTYGLDPNSLTTRVVGGSPGQPASWMDSGYAATPGVQQNVYNGPGGQWTQGQGGGWTNATGTTVSDLPAFLKKQQQVASGSDFSGYQNQLNNLLANPSSVTQTPGYQFALQQGNEAINRSAAAKGMLNSGNVLAELAKYGQGMASQGYQQQLNNLQGLMQGAQQFGVQTGYYNPPTPTNQQAIPGLNKPSWGNY